ncbi:MAG: single-stranded-DNA-specific exonuclease RecJ [Verrucomicrobiota bacterium]|nr:single-stranded-DNA-specific exonuclease RecJ [Verrucomicrobiota bacterium]
MIWQEKTYDCKIASLLEKRCNISSLAARLLSIRKISSVLEAENFLNPKLAHLSDPFEIPQMDEAVERIERAILKKEQILLVGDYDADGISAVSIVQKMLLELGANSSYVIPRRVDEGYGLTQKVIDRGISHKEISLVIALDCGTNSRDEAAFLQNIGIDLIIVDHHQAKDEVSRIPIILNPHLEENKNFPWYNLCTAGLAFKLAHGLIKRLKQKNSALVDKVKLKEFLPLSALGTIADLVPLQDENRIISKFGLKHLGHNPSVGINALLVESKINRNSYPKSEDITFKLAPMINACGRMDNPTVATSLFLEKNPDNCVLLAKKMNEYNEQRKFIETKLTEEAEFQASTLFMDKPAIVAKGDGEWWNPGVVGIVAGKLANSLSKPCLVLAKSENGEYRGSGRGTKGLDLVVALAECKELLLHWGGHPVAVGLSIKEASVEEFTKRFLRAVKNQLGDEPQDSILEIDAFIKQNELTENLLQEIEQLAPFGQANPEPILGLKKVRLFGKTRKVGSGHFQFSIHNGIEAVSGIAWRMAEDVPPEETEIDIAIRLQWNTWNQKKRLQMVLVAWKTH